MIHFEPLQPDPVLKKPAPYGDGALAKLGHVNAVVDRINGVIKGPVEINATTTATAEQISHGVIVSKSSSAITINLPSAADMGSVIGVDNGVSFWLTIDNSAGSSQVDLSLGAGTTANTGTSLTILAARLALFKIHFTTPSTAIVLRVA